jgi:hypothetical protein
MQPHVVHLLMSMSETVFSLEDFMFIVFRRDDFLLVFLVLNGKAFAFTTYVPRMEDSLVFLSVRYSTLASI